MARDWEILLKDSISGSDVNLFCDTTILQLTNTKQSNGMRYLRVGGTRERRFVGTSLQPRKLLKNAATPTRRVHAVLGGFFTIAPQ